MSSVPVPLSPVVIFQMVVSILYITNIFCVITILFFERKDPETTAVWLLIMSYLPGIGVLFYLFFGRGFKLKIHERARLKNDIFKKYSALTIDEKVHLKTLMDFDIKNVKYKNPEMKKYESLIQMHYNMNYSRFTQDNNVEIILTAQEKYDKLIQDIENAEDSIHILYFIIQNDHSGKRLIDALAKKAAQGVKVRLLYDEFGSITTSFRLFSPLKKAGGEVHKFFPFKLGSILRANYRNHRKIVVIDDKIGYTGGMNIGDEYMGLDKKMTPWRDTHLRITGSSVLSLQLRFFLDWYYATQNHKELLENLNKINFPEISERGNTGVQIVASGPDIAHEENKWGIIKMINMAQKSIYIQTPYLMPDSPVLEALYIAAASGVDIRIMIPGIPDKKTVYRVTYSYIENMLNHNIKVYMYNGFIHSKTVVIDDEIATIGTTNFDMRSFKMHFEVNAFIYDFEKGKECSEIFKEDMKSCTLMTDEAYKKRSIFYKFLEGILRLFAPLM